ncbi:bifunctional (p)ppGpp synthetase/guanosine-3',5'-bis(diphosphate) 3'-pyrophosphohydrolase [Limnobacter humi]|uniref:Bifunctional (P)ppGpp synthetase/guanosine-3',5'-bis(Diphosphate) 3'-pyrophosphohydrolase n=1 Tax=Limnobacter humi TaxID=1778671 RepID=A0ABT1WIL0_9BURK|nr:bifunctional (p)ppGpp synthetase/guanosine-3',5'-bis(diphosphate) 3'-pyrophosphohydrolase [Limnobacter humi]MCQ8897349.1 bifunctional (p)ppGpp synthetase/guanosine-3',5'-bis(diphosphate) 3'-pyrophosphohydrolase [Limnobacter humi]
MQARELHSETNPSAARPGIASGVVSIAQLIGAASAYLPEAEIKRVREAYKFSDSAHLGQFRATGEPYITHPIAVAELCASWRLDSQAIQAALLHDVMEDSGATKDDLIDRFGPAVADLVDGLSKLDKMEFSSREEAQAENFRKMLLAMARDLRVILVKLADRLHNMRTLDIMSPSKKRRIALETLEIYAPIAHRLGLNEIFRELQDLSFKHAFPMRYQVLRKAVLAARGNRREVVGKILEAVEKCLGDAKIDCQVYGREKALFGIYRKMIEKRLSFSQVLDVYGFRVVVKDMPTCYLALGMLHQLFKPVPGKFKDYIAIPKVNGYQSLHTTLLGPYGTPVEFQIRTEDMHRVAEKGVASHWLYKGDGDGLNTIQTQTHRLLQSLLDIQNQTGDSAEFLEHIKVDLFPDAVYVFTPNGKIMSLPRGATVVDFAYAVHTDVGNHCVAARVNQVIEPLRTVLKSGDVVEIITAPHSRPNPVWLGFVRSGKARSEIRHYLKSMNTEETVRLGNRLLDQALEADNIRLSELGQDVWDRLMKDSQVSTKEELMADIGAGRRVAPVVARRVLMALGKVDARVDAPASASGQARAPIIVHGGEGMSVQRANCCMPIPGDAIIGYVRKGSGLIIHTDECETARKQIRKEPERWTDVKWAEDITRQFDVNVDLQVLNEKGALATVAATLSDLGANITNLTMSDETANRKVLHFTIQVNDRIHLARILMALRRLEYVERVARAKGKTFVKTRILHTPGL